MADVLLTHSYHLAHDAKQWRKMQPYPPLGTLYAATALERAGISVAVFDATFANPVAGFAAALQKHQPRLVVIYEDDFNFVTKMCLTHMRALTLEFAEIARAKFLPVIAHGSDATDHAATYLNGGITYVLKGEAEQTLTELCASLLRTGAAKALPGLVHYLDDRRTLNTATPAAKNPGWANLPGAARHLIDLEPYRTHWTAHHGFFSTNVVASRGCPYRCNWCAKPISGSHFQLRPAEDVAKELHALKTNHGVEHVWFSDDVFALDRHWVADFSHAVQSLGTCVPFKIQSRADLMSERTVAALARAGCAEVWMGVESGSQKVLDAMSKGLRLEDVYRARRNLANAGIRACYFLQFGYPGEAWPEIRETVKVVRETKPDDIGVSLSYPLPGTLFYERVREQLGAKHNWTDSDDLCIIHTAAYTNDFYLALRDALHAEVIARFDTATDPRCTALWERVQMLEPISRNEAALQPVPSGGAVLLPLTALAAQPREL